MRSILAGREAEAALDAVGLFNAGNGLEVEIELVPVFDVGDSFAEDACPESRAKGRFAHHPCR